LLLVQVSLLADRGPEIIALLLVPAFLEVGQADVKWAAHILEMAAVMAVIPPVTAATAAAVRGDMLGTVGVVEVYAPVVQAGLAGAGVGVELLCFVRAHTILPVVAEE
jgi:hypothetical protein